MKVINNLKKNTIILLFITILILYIVLKDDWINIINTLKTIDIKLICLSFLSFFLSVSIKGYSNYLIINQKEKISLREAIKHNIIIQFFNGITPFSTGGQPMEIYMITEHNISLPKATNYSVQSFIFYQLALVICGIFAIIYNFVFQIFPKVKYLKILVFLGFIINLLVALILLLIANSKKSTNKFCNITKKICHKFKIKKKDSEIEEKFMDLYSGFRQLSKNKALTIIGIGLNIVSLLFLYLVPLFIVYSMGDFTSLNIAETLTSSAYIFLVGAFIPIPGSSGGIEYGFTQFFGNFIPKNKISAVLLIWRFITYYLAVALGGIVFSLEKKVK